MPTFIKDKQYYKFSLYGFLKNLRFFDAFFILFLLKKGLSYTEIGSLYAIRELIINIFEIPSGLIADTYGRKNALMGALFIYMISFGIFYFSDSFWWFSLAFILYGIGDAFRSGTHKGMIMDYLKMKQWEDQKINYYGHTRAWSQKGSAISSLIAGGIVFYSGTYENIFLYAFIPYLLNLLLIASYPSELNFSSQKSKTTNKMSMRQTFRSFYQVTRQPQVLKIINSAAIFTAYLKAVKDYIQPLMVNIALMIPLFSYKEVAQKNGLIIGVIYFFIYLMTSKASQLSSKLVKKGKANLSYTTLFFGLMAGVVCGVFYIFELWVFALLTFIIIYVVENIRKPILTGVLADNVPNDILTSVISAQSLYRTVVTAALAIGFGVLADIWGIGGAFIGITGVLVMVVMGLKYFGCIAKFRSIEHR